MNTTRLQFYLELERPHVLIVTDMRNRSSSVLKVGCNLRMTYIASIKDQNLDVSLLQTDMSCVPFKYSFGTAETAQAVPALEFLPPRDGGRRGRRGRRSRVPGVLGLRQRVMI